MTLRILISNDDGFRAQGIHSLAAAAAAAGHEVAVVCPDRERSASGHGLTLQEPIRVEHLGAPFGAGIEAWCCSGTPSDCVKLALGHLLSEPVDLVLTGINHGLNVGCDVLYSGTVAAAMEGSIHGLPAMAVSSHGWQRPSLDSGAEQVVTMARHLLTAGWPAGLLLNVNLPDAASAGNRRVRWCRPCSRNSRDAVEVSTTADGRVAYNLKLAATLEPCTADAGPRHWPTDRSCAAAGDIAVTPLQPQLFWQGALSELPTLEQRPWQHSASAMDALQQPEAGGQPHQMGHQHLGVAQY